MKGMADEQYEENTPWSKRIYFCVFNLFDFALSISV